jgi:peroxiredoxin
MNKRNIGKVGTILFGLTVGVAVWLVNSGERGTSAISQNETHEMEKIVQHAQQWAPILTQWYGQEAPDISLLDLDGNMHSLKALKGKDVMLIFWATWCGPCRMEIPHLVKLRNEISVDELAILAVSDEDSSVVGEFVKDSPINYTVLVNPQQKRFAAPYSQLQGIPSAFYIDKQGRIKVVSEGLVPAETSKQIQKAQWR